MENNEKNAEGLIMTEQEKMAAGQPYISSAPELRRLSSRAKDLIRAFNALPAGETALRDSLQREILGRCGENVRINQPFFVDYGCHISIGDNSLVNLNCTFLDTGAIQIGRYVLIGPDVKIYTASHPLWGPDRFQAQEDGTAGIVTLTAPVVIRDYAWIGGGTVILPGVTIGRNAVIGAGSVVTQDIPDDAIACGDPCTVRKWNRPGGPVPLDGEAGGGRTGETGGTP